MITSTKDIKHEYQRKWIANRRHSFFRDKSCEKCGSVDRLELDHIDPEFKVTNNIWSWSVERREEELAKCQVLCHFCHKEKTALMFPEPPHGTVSRYRWKHNSGAKPCSCQPCKDAVAAEVRMRRLKKRLSRIDEMQTCNP